MNNYLNKMIGRITQSEKYTWLAKAHVVAISMAFGVMIAVFLGSVVCAFLVRWGLGDGWLLIAKLALLYALELIVVGVLAIGVRAALVQELAVSQGRNWKGRKAAWAGALILFAVALLQYTIMINLSFFFSQ
jgi:hypothetical protein